MNKEFSATKKQKPDMTVKALAHYIERYIGAQFPRASIARWSMNDSQAKEPIAEHQHEDGFHHVSCVVRSDDNYGQLIEFNLVRNNGDIQPIGLARSDSSPQVNLAIAKAITKVIESLYLYHELPMLVDFVAALPGRAFTMHGKVIQLQCSEDNKTLAVAIDGAVVANYDFSDEEHDSLEISANNYTRDWLRLSHNLRMIVSPVMRVAANDEPKLMSMSA